MVEPRPDPSAGVSRREFELVVRRAAELAAADMDAQDRLSEEELMRIAGEVGLPVRYVRQALYEVREGVRPQGWADRRVGPARIVASRSVQGAPAELLEALERYFTTDEYLRMLRRRDQQATFAPSSDIVSKVVRAFRSSGGKYAFAQLQSVGVNARPLGTDRSHLSLELDLADRRRNGLIVGMGAGGVVGATVGFGVGVLGAIAIGGSAPDAGMTLYMSLGGGALGLAGGISAGIAGARAWFRRLSAGFRTEAEGLLDRVERRESLEGPAAPWRRRVERYLGHWPTGGRWSS